MKHLNVKYNNNKGIRNTASQHCYELGVENLSNPQNLYTLEHTF